MVQQGIKAFGRLDVVVANAGFGIAGNLDSLTLDDYRRQFEVNVFGVLRTIYATLDELKKSQGTLVLIGRIVGVISTPGGSPYSMSKFSVHALAQALCHELKPYGESVVLIAPGLVESEFRRVDNQGQYSADAPEGVPRFLILPTRRAAMMIIKAIERRRKFQVITLHGKVLVWAQRHFPGLVSWFLARRLGF